MSAQGAPAAQEDKAAQIPAAQEDKAAEIPAAQAGPVPPAKPLDARAVARDFPLLARSVHGKRIVYLDSAASSQRPCSVIDAMDSYYRTTHANVHRGVYEIAEEADRLYDAARVSAGRLVGSPSPRSEIVFTKNATEAMNLVVRSWGWKNLHAGDVVVLTEIEHHANLVPWLQLVEERGIRLRYLPVDLSTYELDISRLDEVLDGAKVLSCTLMSNVLGTIPPFQVIAGRAHEAGAVVIADGAQSVPHMPTDVQALGCDFLAFSAHKMLGPTGIGVLWGREALLEEMPPFMGGGGMILDVTLDGFVPAEIPRRFEAGTPPIAEAVGLLSAIEYLERLGMSEIWEHDQRLTSYALGTLQERFGDTIRIFGPTDEQSLDRRGAVISLALDGVHPHDLAQVLDQEAVCIRAGHHCAKPLMRRLGVGATARASFYCYNTEEDVDALAKALDEAVRLFR